MSENKAKAAVHVTLISNDQDILDRLEPGAPEYNLRMEGIRNMTAAGIRVVARIEPYLFLVNDNREMVEKYMEDIWDAGVRNLTFDTYSYTAQNPGIRQGFMNQGYDFDRIFLAESDSQPLGSLLLGKFMELFQKRGFSCSTFDMGNQKLNNQSVCCEVGDWFDGGLNYGCTVMAARYIIERGGKRTTWAHFERYVNKNGGFLTDELKREVHELWNLGGNMAYSHSWAAGLTPIGSDENGLIWTYNPDVDERENLLKTLI